MGDIIKVVKLVGGIVLFILAAVALMSSLGASDGGPAPPAGKSLPQVRYAWESTARSVDVTLIGADGKTELRKGESVPGYVEFTSSRGQFLYVGVRNHGRDTIVACTIVVDGVMVREANMSGPNSLAVCGGSIPYDW